MKHYLFLLVVLLPLPSPAQVGLVKKSSHTINKLFDWQRSKKSDSVFVYTETRRLNTSSFFPRPPEIIGLRDTINRTPEFTIRACLTNLKSLNDVRLTVNGEVQFVPIQTPAESNACKGLYYSYALTLPLSTNTISLEASNEGGASIRYAVVTIKP